MHPVGVGLKAAAVAVAILTTTSAEARGQGAGADTPGRFPTGAVIDRVVTAADPDQAYALYLPSDYDPARAWPVLFVMDPRGRATSAIEIFRAGAEASGWIVVSAYGTRSDEPVDPNATALNALFADAQARLGVDVGRLYLAGFSGTARAAWSFASQLRGNVVGVIGVGAGLPPAMTPFELAPPTEGEPDTAFAFFGGTGLLDFNYEEVRQLEGQLALARIPFWIETWDGPHSWPPVGVATRAIEWMEVQWALWSGGPAPERLAAEVADAATARATALEADGALLEAWRVSRDVTRTLAGVTDVGEAERLGARLAADSRLREQRATADRLAREQREIETRMWELLARFRRDAGVLDPDRVRDALELETLRERARDRDPRVAAAGHRTLETLFGQFYFYQPREWSRAGDFERARAALAVADLIEPGSPRTCYQRAIVEARAGAVDAAVEALECAIAAPGFAAAARAEPLLEPIRSEPRVRALLEPPR